jgi:hypothetical protein
VRWRRVFRGVEQERRKRRGIVLSGRKKSKWTQSLETRCSRSSTYGVVLLTKS